MPAPLSSLSLYLKKFSSLRQSMTRYGKAPHKPVLLLTFIDLFERGEHTKNKVCISPEWVARIKETFAFLVRMAHSADFSLPFYRLATEGFWSVRTKLGTALNLHIGGIHTLNDIVDYGRFSDDLYA